MREMYSERRDGGGEVFIKKHREAERRLVLVKEWELLYSFHNFFVAFKFYPNTNDIRTFQYNFFFIQYNIHLSLSLFFLVFCISYIF